jgi:YHS domain-containing protein
MNVKDTIATDPVCGMKWTSRTYFCSAGCERSFERNPQTYLDSSYQPTMGHL